MTAIVLNGWREGLQKVSLTKLQTKLLHKSLKEAKENVDRLLAGQRIELQVEDRALAADFVVQAQALGAACQLG